MVREPRSITPSVADRSRSARHPGHASELPGRVLLSAALLLCFPLPARRSPQCVRSEGAAWRRALYGIVLVAAMSFASGCDESPAFPVPQGPPKRVALVVRLPVYVLGRWTEDTTSETIREELKKYNIEVVDRRAHPDALIHVDLGQFTYREWQEVDVWLGGEGNEVSIGRIRVPDLAWTTLQAAAIPAAALIARSVWAAPPTSAAPVLHEDAGDAGSPALPPRE
jgi:hypothetical protein